MEWHHFLVDHFLPTILIVLVVSPMKVAEWVVPLERFVLIPILRYWLKCSIWTSHFRLPNRLLPAHLRTALLPPLQSMARLLVVVGVLQTCTISAKDKSAVVMAKLSMRMHHVTLTSYKDPLAPLVVKESLSFGRNWRWRYILYTNLTNIF